MKFLWYAKFRKNNKWEWGYGWAPEGMGETCYRFGFGPFSILWFTFD